MLSSVKNNNELFVKKFGTSTVFVFKFYGSMIRATPESFVSAISYFLTPEVVMTYNDITINNC